MKSLLCIFLIFLSFQTISLAQKLTASFSVTPNTIEVGSNHVGRCVVGGFDPSKTTSYWINYYLTTQAGKNQSIGFWSTINLGQKPKFTYASIPDPLGLVAGPGAVGTFPNFDFNFKLKSASAVGKYWCLLQMLNGTTTNETKSNELTTSAAQYTTSFVTNSTTFNATKPFNGACTISGTGLTSLHSYAVNINFAFVGDFKPIGSFNVTGNSPASFKPVNSFPSISASAGKVTGNKFEAIIKPNDKNAAGLYSCSIAVKKSANDSPREYFSNEIKMRSNASWAVPSIVVLIFSFLTFVNF